MREPSFAHKGLGPVGATGRDAPLRRRDVSHAVEFVHEREALGAGGIYLMVGAPQAGGARTLDAVNAALASERTRRHLVRGSLTSGSFERSSRRSDPAMITATREARHLAQELLVKLAVPVPAQGLVTQLIEMSAAAVSVAREEPLWNERTRSDPVTRLLGQAAAERRLVLMVDGLDSANAAWFSQLLDDEWGPDTAADCRAVFVLTLDGPPDPPASETGLPPGLRAATRLTRAGLASWHHLAPIGRDDVAAWLGEATETLITHLWTLGGGSASLTESAWADWANSGSVRANAEGILEFTNDADKLSVRDLRSTALERIRRLVPAEEDGPFDVVLALALGALAGETFTAEVISGVLGLDAPDTLIDFFDARLAEDAGPAALLSEAAHHTVTAPDGSHRHMCRYRFTSTTVWMGLSTRALPPDARASYARALLDATQSLYGAEGERVAGSIAVLAALAGEREAAAHWQRIHEDGPNPELLRWRAHLVLASDHEHWSPSQRAHGVRLLRNAFERLLWNTPAEEIYEYARVAMLLADGAESPRTLAEASRMMGSMCFRAGETETAVRLHRVAFEALTKIGDTRMAATSAIDVDASVEQLERELAPAQRGPLRAERLELLSYAVAFGPSTVGGLALLKRASLAPVPERATLIRRALTMLPTSTEQGVRGRAMGLRVLAEIAIANGELGRARGLLRESHTLLVRLGPSVHLYHTLQRAGVLELAAGEFATATERFAEGRQIAVGLRLRGFAARASSGASLALACGGEHERARMALADAARLADNESERARVAACEGEFVVIAAAADAGRLGPDEAADAGSMQRAVALRYGMLTGSQYEDAS
jgi:hypothetical protein